MELSQDFEDREMLWFAFQSRVSMIDLRPSEASTVRVSTAVPVTGRLPLRTKTSATY